MNNKHKNRNFISFLFLNRKKRCYQLSVLILVLLLLLSLTSNIFSQENNNNSSNNENTTNENLNENNNTDDGDYIEGDVNTDDEGESENTDDDTEEEDGLTYERTIKYDEEVTDADERVYERWVEHIEYGVSKRKENILEWIKETKKEHFVPLLTKILEDEKNHNIIEKAILTAIQLQYYEASEVIEQYLESENKRVQTIAVRALGIFKYEPLADHIEELLDSENKALKNEVIMGIGRLKLDNYTYELIDDIYYDPDAEKVHQESVLKALGMIGTEDACLFLLDIYEDEVNDTNQRALAFRGLILNDYGDIHEHLKNAIETDNLKLKSEALSAMFMFLEKDEIPMDIVYATLKDDNANVRMGALRIIAKHKLNEETIVEFLKYMITNDPVDIVKYTSVGAYLSVMEDDALSFIDERMEKGDQTMRIAVTGLLHLLPADKAIEYAEQELNNENLSYEKTEKDVEQLITSIINIKDEAGIDLMLKVAENPLDYELTKYSLKYYQMIIRKLTEIKQKEKIIPAFKKLIIEKKSLTATSLYPDLYPEDLTPVMLTVINGGEEYGDRMKSSAVYNIIQFGDEEDHLKLKALYEKEDTPKKIKNLIKGYFRSVNINVDMIGKDPEEDTNNNNTVENAPEDTSVEEVTNNEDENDENEINDENDSTDEEENNTDNSTDNTSNEETE